MEIENNNLNNEETHNDFLSAEQISKFIELFGQVLAHDKKKAKMLFRKFYEKLSNNSRLEIYDYKYCKEGHDKLFVVKCKIGEIFFYAQSINYNTLGSLVSIKFSFAPSLSLGSPSVELYEDIFLKHYGFIGRAVLKREEADRKEQEEKEKRCNDMYNECINMLT